MSWDDAWPLLLTIGVVALAVLTEVAERRRWREIADGFRRREEAREAARRGEPEPGGEP